MMELVTIVIQHAAGVPTSVRIPVIKRFGSLVLHYPHDDFSQEFYTLTHASTGRTVFRDNFVIDARLPIPVLVPVLTEIAAQFSDDALATMTETKRAVVDALSRVIENMEKALLSDQDR